LATPLGQRPPATARVEPAAADANGQTVDKDIDWAPDCGIRPVDEPPILLPGCQSGTIVVRTRSQRRCVLSTLEKLFIGSLHAYITAGQDQSERAGAHGSPGEPSQS